MPIPSRATQQADDAEEPAVLAHAWDPRDDQLSEPQALERQGGQQVGQDVQDPPGPKSARTAPS